MKKFRIFFAGFFIVSAAVAFFFYIYKPQNISKSPSQSASALIENPKAPKAPARQKIVETAQIKRNSTFYQTLVKAKIHPKTILKLTSASKPIYKLRNIPANTNIDITRFQDDQSIEKIEIILSKLKTLVLTPSEEEWDARMDIKPVEKRLKSFSGIVETSLWESAVQSGIHPQSIAQIADIFAWQIDFEREVRPKDKWQVLVEELLIDGAHYKWGTIHVAKYWLKEEPYSAIRFEPENKRVDYFNLDGGSLRGKFLKSPLKYSRISSKFQRKRFHPILGVNRPHLGVDYAAPIGTPIRSVGDGRIVFRGRQGGAGKTIKIRHNSRYKTAYKHLNGYARKLKKGSKVTQGQIIGYVGKTGLATGPHLHFEFYDKGRFVDPLGIRFPREKMLKGEEFKKFSDHAVQLSTQLDNLSSDPMTISKTLNVSHLEPQLDKPAPKEVLNSQTSE